MVCIELLGMSRAGKTTQKNSLLRTLDAEGIDAVSLERPKVPFSQFGSAYKFHDFLISYFDENIQANSDKDVIVLDRGLYDRQVLLDFDYEGSAISEREYQLLSQRLADAQGYVDKGFVFMVSPEESVRRWEDQRAKGFDYSHLNKGLDTGDDLGGLSRLHQKYSALLQNPNLERIEGLNSVEENLRQIIGGILTYGTEK